MDDLLIRNAKADDLAGLLDLYRFLNPKDPVPDAARAAAAWSDLLGSAWVTVSVAELGGGLVASCVLVVVPNLTRGARPFGVIENVVTHPDHRRAGLGRAVLNDALAVAWRSECYKVMLATGRPDVVPFYEAIGFRRDGKTFLEIRRP